MPAEGTAAAAPKAARTRATPIARLPRLARLRRRAASPSPRPAPPRPPATRSSRSAPPGHVLDFDDTYLPGIAHLSAPVAPAALVARRRTKARPSATCSPPTPTASRRWARSPPPAIPRSTTAAGTRPRCAARSAPRSPPRALLGADRETAAALAALRAGGLRAAFGSDGKSIQVGLAAATGVTAARLAAAGATVAGRPHRGRLAARPTAATGPRRPADAVARNWIKAWPCCLQTHGAIECAERVDGAARRPDHRARPPGLAPGGGYDAVETPLQAKFSIPYTTAFTLLHGGPRVDDFAALDPEAQALAERITVRTDRAARRVGVRAARRRRGARARRCRPRLAAAPALAGRAAPPRSTTSPAIASTTSPTTSRPPS